MGPRTAGFRIPRVPASRHLKSRTAGFVEQRNEFVPDQFVEFVSVDRDPAGQRRRGLAVALSKLVEFARDAGEIRAHRIAHRRGQVR